MVAQGKVADYLSHSIDDGTVHRQNAIRLERFEISDIEDIQPYFADVASPAPNSARSFGLTVLIRTIPIWITSGSPTMRRE